MASCDVFACIRHLLIPQAQAEDAEKNTARLAVVYGSHALESRTQLDDLARKAKACLAELKEARRTGSEVQAARARSAATSTALKARELRERAAKYENLQAKCERIVEQMRESRQMQHTVSALADAQSQFKRMGLGRMLRGASEADEEARVAQSTMDDISALLGADPSGGAASVVNDADLLAELEALAPSDPVPPQQAMPPSKAPALTASTAVPRRPLVDSAAYGAALQMQAA